MVQLSITLLALAGNSWRAYLVEVDPRLEMGGLCVRMSLSVLALGVA